MVRYKSGKRIRAAGILAVVAGMFLAVIAVPNAAMADTTLLTCVSSHTQSYDPGIQLTPRQVDITIDNVYSDCVAPGTSITSGAVHIEIHNVSASCTLGDLTTSGTNTIHWNTGQTHGRFKIMLLVRGW